LLPAPTAPSEGSAGVRSTLDPAPENRCVTPLLDPGSPAQASLPTEQLPLARSRSCLLDCAARRFAGRSTDPARLLEPRSLEAKTTRCSAALLGPTTLRVPLCFSALECFKPRRARGRSTRPAPHTSWLKSEPEGSYHCLPAEIGPLVTCRFLSPLPVPGRGRDRRPDHLLTMHSSSESRKRKIRLSGCG
jgi:hypothetical protein